MLLKKPSHEALERFTRRLHPEVALPLLAISAISILVIVHVLPDALIAWSQLAVCTLLLLSVWLSPDEG